MNHHLQRTRLVDASHIGSSCIVATLLAISIAVGFNNAAQRGPPDGVEGVEVLTRGPVHEAFVETVTFDPVAGVVALKAPPAPIEELPRNNHALRPVPIFEGDL